MHTTDTPDYFMEIIRLQIWDPLIHTSMILISYHAVFNHIILHFIK